MSAHGLGRLVWWATRPLLPPGAVEHPVVAAEAVVVLGAPLRADGTCSTTLEERVGVAAALYHEGLAPLVVLAGGVSVRARTAVPEAEGMARLARRLGVPEEALLLERESKSTAENAARTVPLLAARGVRRILLVTHAYHLRRATRRFAEHGLEVEPVLLSRSFLYQGGEGSRVGARLLVREVVVHALDRFRRH